MKTEVSELLMRWSAGDESALEFLTPLVYQELRRLGRSALRRGGPHSIVQPTVLVHEAWLRLTGNQRFETAEVVGVSHATMLRAQDGRPSAGPLRFEREWNFARAWLRRELQPGAQAAVRS